MNRLSCEPRSPHGGTGRGHFARLFGFFGSWRAAQVAHHEPPTLDSVASFAAVFRSPTLPDTPVDCVFCALCGSCQGLRSNRLSGSDLDRSRTKCYTQLVGCRGLGHTQPGCDLSNTQQQRTAPKGRQTDDGGHRARRRRRYHWER